MRLFAPSYYKNFKCIADKCTHSCCIGWEIDVDHDTLEIYESLSEGYGKEIRNSIDFSGTPHFKLELNDKCPHLDQTGLCKIIKNFGEGFLCHICREHPRFYNNTSKGMEVGLGMSCEEAARIILTADSFCEIVEIEKDSSNENIASLNLIENDTEINEEQINGFNPLEHRQMIFDLLSDDSFSYIEKLEYVSKKYKISPLIYTDCEWRNVIASLEYLDENHKKMFLNYSSSVLHTPKYEKYLLRFFAYFVFRHCTEAGNENEFSSNLGFCLFCERLFFSALDLTRCNTLNKAVEIARIISEELEYSEENTEAVKQCFYNL